MAKTFRGVLQFGLHTQVSKLNSKEMLRDNIKNLVSLDIVLKGWWVVTSFLEIIWTLVKVLKTI